MSAGLITRLVAQRTGRVEVAPGKALFVLRPLEAEMGLYRAMSTRLVIGQVTGWEGMTEADFMPPGVGASTAVEFDRTVADEVLGDRTEWVGKASTWIVEAIEAHLATRKATAKN